MGDEVRVGADAIENFATDLEKIADSSTNELWDAIAKAHEDNGIAFEGVSEAGAFLEGLSVSEAVRDAAAEFARFARDVHVGLHDIAKAGRNCAQLYRLTDGDAAAALAALAAPFDV
jgi:hypothetical protein